MQLQWKLPADARAMILEVAQSWGPAEVAVPYVGDFPATSDLTDRICTCRVHDPFSRNGRRCRPPKPDCSGIAGPSAIYATNLIPHGEIEAMMRREA